MAAWCWLSMMWVIKWRIGVRWNDLILWGLKLSGFYVILAQKIEINWVFFKEGQEPYLVKTRIIR